MNYQRVSHNLLVNISQSTSPHLLRFHNSVSNCSLLQRQCCAHSKQRPHGAAPAAAHPQRVPVHGGGGGEAPGARPARPGPGAASQEVQGGPGRPRTLRHATRDTWRRVVTTLVVN